MAYRALVIELLTPGLHPARLLRKHIIGRYHKQ
jgi:hypothetical protein